jgi:hypothetical protein
VRCSEAESLACNACISAEKYSIVLGERSHAQYTKEEAYLLWACEVA